MRKFVVAMLTGTCLLCPQVLAATEEVHRPQYRDGEVWQFKYRTWDHLGQSSTDIRNGTYEVVYRNGRFNVFFLDGTKRTRARAGVFLGMLAIEKTEEQKQKAKEAPVLTSPWEHFLEFPLYLGKKPWEYRYQERRSASDAKSRLDYRRVRTTLETVGEFRSPEGVYCPNAYKHVRENYGRSPIDGSGGPSRYETVYYYCPETKSVSYFFFDSSVGYGEGFKTEIVLLKFGRRKQAVAKRQDNPALEAPQKDPIEASARTGGDDLQ